MRKFLTTCCMFLMHAVSAYTAPCPGKFDLSVEWLYMLPSYDQPYFAIDSIDLPPIGRRVANEQQWHSGYRIEGGYAFCNHPNNIFIRWTHFPTFSNHKSISGNALFAILIHPNISLNDEQGTMSLRDTFDFHYLDVLFSQELIYCGPFRMDLLGGVQYGYLDLREQFFYDDDGGSDPRTVKMHSQLWGIGPEMGYAFSYFLLDCLTLAGQGNVSLLISERKASINDTEGTSLTASTDNDPYWTMVPTTDLRFGLNYSTELNFSWIGCLCGRINMNIEVGYEVISFFNGLYRTYYVDHFNEGSSLDELMNFTVHGPYLHLSFTF